MNEHNKSITLTIAEVMGIAHWMESHRNPYEERRITIEVTETDSGFRRTVKAYVETDKNSGVWRDFTNYNRRTKNGN